MAKQSPDQVLDAMLAEIATSTRLVVCSAEPANFAGIAAVNLAQVTLTAGLGNGDFTAANGDVSGRKVTVTQQTSISVTTSGTATHISLDDAVDLQYVTTCTSQALTAGNTVTVPAWKVEVNDPT